MEGRHELAQAPRPPGADPRAEPARPHRRRPSCIFGSLIDNYYTFRTFNRIASSVAIITVVAVGQTLVVLTRNIDLSVGSIVGFTAYFVGTLIANHNGINPFLAVAVAIALGAALGVVNGVIVAWGRVPAVVVTLGTLAIYRGVLVDLSGAKTVTTDSLPQWLINLPAGQRRADRRVSTFAPCSCSRSSSSSCSSSERPI